jgi:hypothetical protein
MPLAGTGLRGVLGSRIAAASLLRGEDLIQAVATCYRRRSREILISQLPKTSKTTAPKTTSAVPRLNKIITYDCQRIWLSYGAGLLPCSSQ